MSTERDRTTAKKNATGKKGWRRGGNSDETEAKNATRQKKKDTTARMKTAAAL
jgi:hypothetical protein